jgi:CrcB protein
VERSGIISSTQAIFLINIVGSFIIGALFCSSQLKAWLSPDAVAMVSVGFLGALTTFSTFSLDTFRMFQAGDWERGLLYLVLSPVLGVFACFVGFNLVKWVF